MHAPEPDLITYNPNGPDAEFARYYRSSRAAQGTSSPGLPAGWYDSYDCRIVAAAGSGWRDLALLQPGGVSETFAVSLNGGAPTGSFSRPNGAPYRLTGVPSPTVPGRWDSLTLSFKDLTKWRFLRKSDAEYWLWQIEDQSGKFISINRTASRVLSSVKDQDNNTLLFFALDSSPYITRVVDSPGYRRVNLGYAIEAGGSVLKQVSVVVDGNVSTAPLRWQYQYMNVLGSPLISAVGAPDASSPNVLAFNSIVFQPENGRVASFTDANGFVTTYDYLFGATKFRKVSGTSAYDSTRFFDGRLRETGFRDAAGKTASISFADVVNPMLPTAGSNRLQQTESIVYDADGNPVSHFNLRNVATSFSYDRSISSFGLVSAVQTTGLTATSLAYDSRGYVSEVSGPVPGAPVGSTQVTAQFTYNGLGDVTEARKINAAGGLSVTTYEYQQDTDLELGAVNLPSPRKQQPLRITDPLGRITRFRYDNRGNMILAKAPDGAVTDFQYNTRGQLTRILHPATGMTGSGRGWTSFVYNNVGGALKGIYEFDESGIQAFGEDYGNSKEADARAASGSLNSYEIQKDAIGRVTRHVDGNLRSTISLFATVGALQRFTRPLGQQNNLTWNFETEITGVTNARNEAATIVRAPDDSRVTGIQYAADATLNVGIQHDVYGRVTSISDAAGSRTYTYDSLGNVTLETTRFTGLSGDYVVTYTYNPDGSIAAMATPAGSQTYNYNAAGEVTRVTAPWVGGIVDYTYDVKGRLAKQKTPKFETDLTYNQKDQLTSLITYARNTPSAVRYAATNIAYAGSGVPITATITQPFFSSTAPHRSGFASWQYDSRLNLIGESRLLTSGSPLYPALTLTYDGAGNPRNAFGRALAYNGNSDVSTAGFTTDAQGNPTVYDGISLNFNKADQFTGKGGYTLLNYEDGRAARKTTTAGKETYFLYDTSGRVICEIAGSSSSVPAGNVYGAYAYGPGGLTTRRNGATAEYDAYAFDLFGHVAVRHRQTDSVVDASEIYDSFGRVFARYNVQAAGADPVTDPVGAFGQWGARVEEEDRAGAFAQFVRWQDGQLFDPATGRAIKSHTAPPSTNAYANRVSGGVTDPLKLTAQVSCGVFKGVAKSMPYRDWFPAEMLEGRTKLERASGFGAENLAMLGGLASAGTLPKGASKNVTSNRIIGNSYRDEVATALRTIPQNIVKTEAYVRTPFGGRFYDVAVFRKLNGETKVVGYVEAKVGRSRYQPSHRAKDEWVRRNIAPVNLVRKPND